MLNRLFGALRWVIAEFGPLVVFWALDIGVGLKAAIAGSLLFILGDSIWRWLRGVKFTRLYVLISGLTLVFGAIDLLSATPFMLKYEAVITNVVTGVAFVVGSRGPRPIIQELAEQRQGAPYPDRPDLTRFFQIFTLLWAAYFFLKAGFYLAVGQMMPMVQAMAIRSVVGSASLAVMMLLSFTQGRRLFLLCQRIGLLPPPSEPTR
jgi:intracellular septation protein A